MLSVQTIFAREAQGLVLESPQVVVESINKAFATKCSLGADVRDIVSEIRDMMQAYWPPLKLEAQVIDHDPDDHTDYEFDEESQVMVIEPKQRLILCVKPSEFGDYMNTMAGQQVQ